jgi:hypothetical protein
LRKDFVKEYVPRVKQAIFDQLLETTQAEMKKETRTSFKDISKSLKALLGLIMSPEEIDKVIDGTSRLLCNQPLQILLVLTPFLCGTQASTWTLR